ASCVVALSRRDSPTSTRLRSMFRRSWESGLGQHRKLPTADVGYRLARQRTSRASRRQLGQFDQHVPGRCWIDEGDARAGMTDARLLVTQFDAFRLKLG